MQTELSRKKFISSAALTTAGLAVLPGIYAGITTTSSVNPLRLGGPVDSRTSDPVEWVKALKRLGYSAAYCPVQPGEKKEVIRAFETEAGKNDIIISEVGAWSNPLSPDESIRKEAIKKNTMALALADEIGAVCCVNISGARGEVWDGPYPENYSAGTFDLIVQTIRMIIDEVKPRRSYYTLEPMPYMLPDSPGSYLQLMKAIDRKNFGVHLDPVNMISSPERYFKNGEFLKECFSKLGPYIKSIHAKDIIVQPELTFHLNECRPGQGYLDYVTFLKEASKLKDVPFMLEHLKSQDDYKLAAEFVRRTAMDNGITIRTYLP